MHLLADPERARELVRQSHHWPSLTLDPQQTSHLELLLDGSFAPLAGFMGHADADACAAAGRLADGTFWPCPILLEVPDAIAAVCPPGSSLVLRDGEGRALAVLHVADRWSDGDASKTTRWRLGGRVEGLQLPVHYDFRDLRRTPDQVVAEVARRGWTGSIAFQTGDFIHRAQFGMLEGALEQVHGGVLVQAVLPDDAAVDARHYARVRAHRSVVARLGNRGLLSLLPSYAASESRPHLTGLQDLLGAIVAKNHGCTHIIVTPAVAAAYERTGGAAELGITPLAIEPQGTTLSTEEIDVRLGDGRELSADFTFDEVGRELRALMPPRTERGLTLWFTGLSGSGKSTIANAVRTALLERSLRTVTLLDGDLVRQNLSSELGFSREHRDLNVRRIGFVAREITKHRGIAICAPISPYDAVRREVRHAIEAVGGFVLIFVDTPLEVCAQRDPKGLYARARAGLIKEFTGVSDPYEPPADADLTIRTADTSVEQAAVQVVTHVEQAGYLSR